MIAEEEKFKPILEQLCKEIAQVKAIALAEINGSRLLAQFLPPTCDAEVVCSVIAPAIKLVENSISAFGPRQAKKISIKGKSGFVVLYLVNKQIALLLHTSNKVQMATLNKKVQKAARQIAGLLENQPAGH